MVLHPLEVEIIPDSAAVTLRLAGDLDMATVDTLRACLTSVDPAFSTVVIDLAALRFLDSTGLGCFAALHRELEVQLRRLELRGAQGHVRQVLEISGITGLVPTG